MGRGLQVQEGGEKRPGILNWARCNGQDGGKGECQDCNYHHYGQATLGEDEERSRKAPLSAL